MVTAERVAARSREYGLDWLRVLAFAILIFYHSGMMFVSWGWHIENTEKSAALEYVMLFFNRWRRALLFFISGAGVWFSLRQRGPAQFAGELLFLRAKPGQRLIGALASALRWRPALYAIALPSLLIGLTLGPRWPTTHNLISDWANLTGTFVTFLWGFILCSRREFLDMFVARRRELLIGALITTVLFYALPRSGFREIVSGYMGFFWVLTLVGMAHAHWNRDSNFLRYATEAVYPFYIVHQTITVAAGYYIIQLPWPVLPKLALSTFVTVLGSWLIYEGVKRTAITRLPFGLKLKPAAPQV